MESSVPKDAPSSHFRGGVNEAQTGLLVHLRWLSQIGAGRRRQLCPIACHPGRAQSQPALTPPSRYVTCIKPLVQWIRRLAQGPLVSKWQSRDRGVGSQVQMLGGDHCTILLLNDPINQGGRPQVLPRGFANPETQTCPSRPWRGRSDHLNPGNLQVPPQRPSCRASTSRTCDRRHKVIYVTPLHNGSVSVKEWPEASCQL